MKKAILVGLVSLVFSVAVKADENASQLELKKREMIASIMPAEPKGFHWKLFYGIGVLCPKEWAFTYPSDQVQGRCVSPKLSDSKITIDLLSVTDKDHSASHLVGQLIEKVSDNGSNRIELFEPIARDKIVFRYSDKARRTHQYFIANDQSKRLYVITLTSSVANWNASWDKGETVFKNVALLPMWESL